MRLCVCLFLSCSSCVVFCYRQIGGLLFFSLVGLRLSGGCWGFVCSFLLFFKRIAAVGVPCDHVFMSLGICGGWRSRVACVCSMCSGIVAWTMGPCLTSHHGMKTWSIGEDELRGGGATKICLRENEMFGWISTLRRCHISELRRPSLALIVKDFMPCANFIIKQTQQKFHFTSHLEFRL